jgi:hypothetical protein
MDSCKFGWNVIFTFYNIWTENGWRFTFVLEKRKKLKIILTSIYGSTVLCWTLAAFQFLNPIHSR